MANQCSPIIRVCRKRSADPHSALVVQFKRQKADPLLFSLFKTCDEAEPEFSEEVQSNKLIDFCSPPNVQREDEVDMDNPLAFANDSIQEIGGPEPVERPNEEVITVNGRPMVSSRSADNDFVFDFYKISRGIITDDVDDFALWDMRFATKEEEQRLCHDDDSESDTGCHDDDDDSNDEGNWRNDYPDEGENSNSSENDSYDYNDDDSGDDLRLRIQRFGFDDEEYNSDDDEEDDF